MVSVKKLRKALTLDTTTLMYAGIALLVVLALVGAYIYFYKPEMLKNILPSQ